jgi:hypothetical protein
MKKTLKIDTKSTPVQIEAPIVLTPEQIAEVAAGMVAHSGGGTTTSGIVARAK